VTTPGPSSPDAAVLQIRGLSKRYRDGDRDIEVLRNLNLDLASGASLAITGPSGSGKSTLLNILAGILSCDSGEVVLNLSGKTFALHAMNEQARTRMRRRYVGYVYQFFNLVPTLTVLENVRLPARLNKRRDLDQQAQDLLVDFGLQQRLHMFPEVLSGGEQQRVAVARALIMQPPLLLADEPTGNLDASNTAQVAQLLFQTARRMGISVIVATHSDDIAARADHHLRLGAHPSAAVT
jgi:putative ABC transport system ATP-binding protein